MRYICQVCGYIYDEETGDHLSDIPPNTRWENVPDTWLCPLCMVEKSEFCVEEKDAS